MSCDEEDNSGALRAPGDENSRSAVNSLILDYYKKFGRKRDLEQYFSLSTAQNEIRDPSSVFWRRIKAENDSSDSGEKSDKNESSQELCRISIRCSVQDPCTSQEADLKSKTESESPPIIIEEVSHESSQKSGDESLKSDDNNSQKSYDVLLDTSMNKPLSPSSSITSQRKLEWDSLADVGYANESDRKTSASSLSTLERLALKQHYSNNDTKQDSNIGLPTAHSTPLDNNEGKSKSKKGIGKKTTKIYKKDVDFVEVSVPHSTELKTSQSINVNLTKHISFNVEKDGKVSIDNVQKEVNVSPDKVTVETGISPRSRMDKVIQTSLIKSKESSTSPDIENTKAQAQKIPILLSLNTLRKRTKRKKIRMARRNLKSKKRPDKKKIPVQEKSGEQLSEAESFEYMPGHIYNQNQMTANNQAANVPDNKSSLESSGVTTDSSKGSKHSFTKDLEKSIDLLKAALQQRCDDSNLRKQLIKQVCQRLLKSRYRDDESTTDFLSGLSFSSKKLGLGEGNHTTTSTSDANNSTDKSKRPKKSILRSDKFNPAVIASTSQSTPNLPVASTCDKLVSTNLVKNLTTSNTDSDISSKEKSSSENVFAKTSSEELYQKYLQALKREEAYKRHLKDKETFLKQKLVSSDSAFKIPVRAEVKPNNGLKDLINDLTRNNYDDGSGDASKLEGGPGSNINFDRSIPVKNQKSHSVFTLSSGNSDSCNKRPNLKKRLKSDIKDLSKPGPSKDTHYCCCPHHSGNAKIGVVDSSVQVNIKHPCTDDSCPARERKHSNISPIEEQRLESPRSSARVVSVDEPDDLKYVCLCSNKALQDVPENFLIYKCSRLTNRGIKLGESLSRTSNEVSIQCCYEPSLHNNCGAHNAPSTSKCPVKPCTNDVRRTSSDNMHYIKGTSKSSQTNMLIKILRRESSDCSLTSSDDKKSCYSRDDKNNDVSKASGRTKVYEATRCLQTVVSINPRRAEPCLSDINIVNDNDCAKLISESCKELDVPSLTDIYSSKGQADVETCTDSGSAKSSGACKNLDDNFGTADKPKESLRCNENNRNEGNSLQNVDNSEKFTIPIEGTNMTLMVSIGSNERSVFNKKKTEEMVTQAIGTEKVNVIEQATSLAEECSKAVQSENLNNCMNEIDHNSNQIDNGNKNSKRIIEASFKNTCTVNTCLEEPKFDTYPKTSPVNDRKPFLRSNTADTINFDKVCKTDGLFFKKDAGIQENISMETQTTEHNIKKKIFSCGGVDGSCIGECNNNNNGSSKDKCTCGCAGTKDNCKRDCIERTASPREQNREPSEPYRKLSLNNNFSDKQSNRCSCGCSGTKDNCKMDCFERTASPTEQRNKQSSEQYRKLSLNNNYLSEKPNDKCSCGCKGTKDNCKMDCVERNASQREQIRKLSLEQYRKLSLNNDNFTDKQNDKYSGTKNKCKRDCVERTASPREKIRKPSLEHYRKLSLNDNTYSEDKIEMCSCGCYGNKDNCKITCIERTEPSKDQYSKQSLNKTEIGIQKDLPNGQEEVPGYSGSCQTTLKPVDQFSGSCQRTQNAIDQKASQKSNQAQCFIDEDIFKKPYKIVDSGSAKSSNSSYKSQKSYSEAEQPELSSDPIMNMIKDITKRYSKKDIEQNKKKKCFKEIMTVLNYLLETDDSSDRKEDGINTCQSIKSTPEDSDCRKETPVKTCQKSPIKKFVDKAVQLPKKSKSRHCATESSDFPISTDMPGTSTDSATCKVLNKIKKECERYHQKRCKIYSGKRCDASSSTSVNCDQCRRVHHCLCRSHKCHKGNKRSSEMIEKKSVAYNLIIQTSESMISETTVCGDKNQLKNIIVKVPKKRYDNVPFNEIATKLEENIPQHTPQGKKCCRSRSLPNESEISSMEEIIRKTHGCTVREYLEKNRPDFVEKASQRQNCLKYICETRNEESCVSPRLKMIVVHTPNCMGSCNMYCGGVPMTCVSNSQCFDPCLQTMQSGVTRIAIERAAQRELLSLHMAQMPNVTNMDSEELCRLAKEMGRHMRQKRPAPKIISEREFKKHSEKIYKSLPEVVRKKEEIKKENIKKTNLLMANIFKTNLQKKTLRGSVNLSNYSPVIKI